MASGGARARSGPPPDPNALRRDRDASEWTRIPSARTGPTPPWPLGRATKRELVLWEAEWKRPQAVMWEAYGQFIEVAVYVRHLRESERTGSSATARNLLIRQMDSLGLTIAGLARNRWIIAADDVVGDDHAPAPPRQTSGGPSAKERLAGRGMGVVDGGA